MTERPPYFPPKWTAPSVIRVNAKRMKVGDRDGWICQLCKEPIKYIQDSTLDHIIPVEKGGTWKMTNLQIAHGKCNNAKGNSSQQLPPEYFKNFISKGRQRRKARKETTITMIKMGIRTTPDDFHTNHCAALWNEVAKNGLTNLSYNLFEQYFEKYAAVKIKKLGLLPPIEQAK